MTTKIRAGYWTREDRQGDVLLTEETGWEAKTDEQLLTEAQAEYARAVAAGDMDASEPGEIKVGEYVIG